MEQRRCGSSDEPPPPPRALAVAGRATTGSDVVTRASFTLTPSPLKPDIASVANSSEVIASLPYSITGVAVLAAAVSPHPFSLSLPRGAGRQRRHRHSPVPSRLSPSLCHVVGTCYGDIVGAVTANMAP
jgi:hypothetical protein